MKDVPISLADQEFDAESGLYNYDARMYDPVIGRFISPDNIIPHQYNPQSLNRYSYCLNNPLIYTDPTGHAVSVSSWIPYGWPDYFRDPFFMHVPGTWGYLAGAFFSQFSYNGWGGGAEPVKKGSKGLNWLSNFKNGINTQDYNRANSFMANCDSEDHFIVMVHGNEDGGTYEPYFGEPIKFNDAFKMHMIKAGWAEGTPVLFLSCYGGKTPDNGISSAQQLATLLCVDVWAFDGLIEYGYDGTLGYYYPIVGDPEKPDYSNEGEPFIVTPD